MGRVRLTGSGWSREVEEPDASLLVARLRATDNWGLASRIAQKLEAGGEVALGFDEKKGLFATLKGMRNGGGGFPSRLAELLSDLEDDLAGYES